MTPLHSGSAVYHWPATDAPLVFDRRYADSLLSDQRSSNADIAALFKQAYVSHQLDALNDLIRSYINQSGTFFVNEQVRDLLLQDRFKLTQHRDGRISIKQLLTTYQDKQRHHLISDILPTYLPADLIKLVHGYDSDRIEFSTSNEAAIINAFKSKDPVIKGEIIRQAVEKREECFLNTLFKRIKIENMKQPWQGLNLTGVDLSGINLSLVELSYTNLTAAELTGVSLQGTRIYFTNFGAANLKHADMRYMVLEASRLHVAELSSADLRGATLQNVDLNGANLCGANLTGTMLDDVNMNGANLSGIILDSAFATGATCTGAMQCNAIADSLRRMD